MTTSRVATHSSKFRFLLAAVAVVAVLAGCSSSDTSTDKVDDATEQSDGANGDAQSGNGPDGGSDDGPDASGEFPEGFPDDLPLPEYEDVSVVSSDPTGPQVMLTIDSALETPGEDIMEAYADQLDAAGFEVSGEPTGQMEATGDMGEVLFHSSMDGTLTIAVLPA